MINTWEYDFCVCFYALKRNYHNQMPDTGVDAHMYALNMMVESRFTLTRTREFVASYSIALFFVVVVDLLFGFAFYLRLHMYF